MRWTKKKPRSSFFKFSKVFDICTKRTSFILIWRFDAMKKKNNETHSDRFSSFFFCSLKTWCYSRKTKHKLKSSILASRENFDQTNRQKKRSALQNLLVRRRDFLSFRFIRLSNLFCCLAPEVIAFEPVSLATDMWSIGVITYILFVNESGEFFFEYSIAWLFN